MTHRMAAPGPAFGTSFKPAKSARGRELQREQAAAQHKTRERYERVAKHEWARKRVCQVLKNPRFDQWNGYVPPVREPAANQAPQLSKPNTAHERGSLVQLLRDVAHFEETGKLPDYATKTDEEDE